MKYMFNLNQNYKNYYEKKVYVIITTLLFESRVINFIIYNVGANIILYAIYT